MNQPATGKEKGIVGNDVTDHNSKRNKKQRDVSVEGHDVRIRHANTDFPTMDGSVTDGIRYATKDCQERKNIHKGTEDVTASCPEKDANNQPVSTRSMSRGIGKGDRLETDRGENDLERLSGNADEKESESLDPDQDSDVTAKGTTNGDKHDDVTVRHDAEDYKDTKQDGDDVADKQGVTVIGSGI